MRVPLFVRKTLFRLPFKSTTPVILIGPGTGFAPFRGFIQERHVKKMEGWFFSTSTKLGRIKNSEVNSKTMKYIYHLILTG